MRGSVSSSDLFQVYSVEDREILVAIIDENIKATMDSGIPLI